LPGTRVSTKGSRPDARSHQRKGRLDVTKYSFSFIDFFGRVIFASRLMLTPMYLALYVALGVYNWVFFKEVFHLATHFNQIEEADLLLIVIGLIDMTMIGNLIDMTMVGGYSIFVREYDYDKLKDKPRWMHGFNTTAQKAKLAMSMIAITAVYMLKDYIQADQVSWDTILKRALMIGVFVVIGLAFGAVARMTPHDQPHDHKEHH
jgi:uncharacterized protein (TIGR00645 family)